MIINLHSRKTTTLNALQNRTAKVCVIGLGYVGLPLVQLFVKAGFQVTGFDVDDKKVNKLNAGESYIKHVDDGAIQEMLATKRFSATADDATLKEMDAIVICVPTPLTEHHEPDMSYITSTCEVIQKHLREGQLIVLESTTYPGTTRTVVQPLLEKSGLSAETDFFMAYSPEREDPGNPTHSAAFIPKVVGGLNKESHELACALYSAVVPEVVPVSSPEIAEACKILENTYRAVNIALVNELKMLFERMDIDIWEVINAAKTKPFGFHAFYPGPGLGGHCIPIDPFYLSWVARQYNYHTRFIELAGEVNTSMPEHVVHRVTLALNSHGKAVRGSKICILGMAYKKNVDDVRESPSLELYEMLHGLGGEVSYHDPYVPEVSGLRNYDLKLESVSLTPAYLQSVDAVLVATDHDKVDYEMVAEYAPLVIDTRNVVPTKSAEKQQLWAA